MNTSENKYGIIAGVVCVLGMIFGVGVLSCLPGDPVVDASDAGMGVEAGVEILDAGVVTSEDGGLTEDADVDADVDTGVESDAGVDAGEDAPVSE